MDADQALVDGRRILEPVFGPAGFAFVVGSSGHGSGGYFASGAFERPGRRLELHFRYSLGLVTYHVGAMSLDHRQYMRALGHERDAAYPGFSSDPLDGFRHLRSDLARFGAEFLEGSDAQFCQRVDWAKSHPVPHGLASMQRQDV
jgi:hypothetical protein